LVRLLERLTRSWEWLLQWFEPVTRSLEPLLRSLERLTRSLEWLTRWPEPLTRAIEASDRLVVRMPARASE
jgi:hypothetical protein